ncbi:hypothetical protein [Lacticaseibacillus porcinae]|uniref:hypothetical protein n=1 Tax=Lacticaseibacillus porcinae TaxID=1123687 RepID=UPI000F79446A|nr:hypothetical protein [Lacticaseibacillus porcinae]
MPGVVYRIGTGEAMLASAEIIALIAIFLLSAPWWAYVVVTIAIVLAFVGGRFDAKTEQKDPKSFRNGVAFRPWNKHRN